MSLLLGILPSSAAAAASISGTVTAEDTEDPLEFVSVCIYEAGGSGSFVDCDSTGAAGDYSVTVPGADNYVIRFGAPFESGYVDEYWNDKPTFSAADPIAVGAEEVRAGIDVELEPEATIGGTITDADSAEPIEGIEACAYFAADQSFADCGTTDSSGAYLLTGLPGDSYKVRFDPGFECEFLGCDEYLTQYYDGATSFGGADVINVASGDGQTGIDATMHKGGRVSGTVTDTAEAPLESVEVCIYRSGSFFWVDCAFTDASGDYFLSALQADDYVVRFDPPFGANYVREFFDDKTSFNSADEIEVFLNEETSGVDAELEEGGIIEGVVTEAGSGEPLDVITACAHPAGGEENINCGSADASGNYAINQLPTGSYKVRFFSQESCEEESCIRANYLTQYYDEKDSFATADAVAVTAGGAVSGINAAMQPGGQIKGTVTAEDTGEPLADASVCASSGSGFESTCASADSGGEYTIPALPTGSYRVSVSPGFSCGSEGCGSANYVPEYYNDKENFQEADPVAVTAGSDVPGIDVTLAVGAQIQGTVTDADAGEPIAGIGVCVDEGGFQLSCRSTDGDGEYTLNQLRPGTHLVRFAPGASCGPESCESQNYLRQWYDGKSSLASADPVVVAAPGELINGIDAAMQPGGVIEGTVTGFDTGEPVGGISVCAEGSSGAEFRCDSTDSGGQYSIVALQTGSYRVRFSAITSCSEEVCSRPNYLGQYFDDKDAFGEADLVSVTAGQTVSAVDASLDAGGQIKGVVTDQGTGEPLEGVPACASGAGSPEFVEGACSETDDEGKYTINGLSTGSFVVQFNNCAVFSCGLEEYAREYYDGKASRDLADPIAVTAGSAVNGIGASLVAGGEISGNVIDSLTEEPVGNIQVCARLTGDETSGGCSETDTAGNYTINQLPIGNYLVRFEAGFECIGETCAQQEYAPQHYDGKLLAGEASLVAVSTPGSEVTGIDAEMQQGGSIAGTITDAGNGEPAPGVSICAYQAGDDAFGGCTETDGDGTYEINALAPVDHKVEFGPGIFCEEGECFSPDYGIEYWDEKSSYATADLVSVTTGAVHGDIDAAMSPPPEGQPPVNTVAPVLSGTPEVGETLSCSQGSWDNEPTEYDYAWRRNGVLSGGQTATTYVVQGTDVGATLRCEVTATNADGSDTAQSNGLVVATPAPVNTTPPALTGTPAVGETLSCSQGSWEYTPTAFAYSWRRGATLISGENSSSYVVQNPDRGFNVSCEVTASNSGGATTAASNAFSIPAPPGAPVETTPPVLTGTAAVGQTLVCSNGAWENSPTEFDHAWRRSGSPIPGEAASSYVIAASDAGHAIGCEVTATNATGSAAALSNTLQVPASAPVDVPVPSDPEPDEPEQGSESTSRPSPTPPQVPSLPRLAPEVTPGKASAAGSAKYEGGAVLLTLKCSGPGACKGLAKLTVRDTSKRKSKRKNMRRAQRSRKRSKTVVVGKSQFSIAAGSRKVVKIRLNGKGKAMLRKAGKQALRLKLAGTGIRPTTIVVKPAKSKSKSKRKRAPRGRRSAQH
jgi:hypothetical protein